MSFVTFEGLDGSGKSTQIRMLCSWLEELGHTVMTVREPGGSQTCERIRDLVLNTSGDLSDRAEMFLFMASRSQLVEEKIRPALDSGTLVICDRFADSTLAYQGYGRGLQKNLIEQCNQFAIAGLVPKVTFYLDLSVQAIASRVDGRNSEKDRMESLDTSFFTRVRNGYLAIAENHPARFIVLNGEDNVDTIHSQICSAVRERILQP